MNLNQKEAVVLWTGGKDSALALHEALDLGYSIRSLITFVPSNPRFLAHPLPFMQLQASALAIPHVQIEVQEPFREGYQKAIRNLKEQGIRTLVTGDISEVDGLRNWILECSQGEGMDVWTPLWGRNRLSILQRLFVEEFKVTISCVKDPYLTPEWLGREINAEAIEELCQIHEKNGLDLCGEQGEFHTLVKDSPLFQKRIEIDSFSRQTLGVLSYLDLHKIHLVSK